MSNYVDFHKQPAPPKKELADHEVFNNALMRAQAAGEKPSAELFSQIDKEYNEKKKEKAAMSLYALGAKLANVTGMTYDPDHANVKKLKAQHPNNWRQVMAKSQGLSDSSMAKAIKKAQSACSPCAMPNGPAKKLYTSASPAVTDASQKSVEIGKPPVTKTEHSEAKAKQPEEGVKVAVSPSTGINPQTAKTLNKTSPFPAIMRGLKRGVGVPANIPAASPAKTGSAMAFGMKVAENLGDRIITYGGPRNALDTVIDGGVKGVNAVKSIPGKIWGAGESLANYGGPRNAMDSVIDAGVSARNGVGNAMQTLKDSRGIIPRTGEAIANYGGPRNTLDTVVDAGVSARNAIGSGVTGLNNARLSAGKRMGEAWAAGGDDGGRGYQGPPGSTPQVSGKVGPKPDAVGAGAGTGAAGGGILDTLYNNRYPIAGGLGALGLGGLLYHLNSQPKKKKRDEEEA